MVRVKPLLIPRPITAKSEPDADTGVSADSGTLYKVAVEIAKERGEKLKLLKAAILRQDTAEVYRIASFLCGLEFSEERKRV